MQIRTMKYMMFLQALLLFTVVFFTPSFGYRDGATEESCYDHLVNHTGAFVVDCIRDLPVTNPLRCRYFLRIMEVVNETTLELGTESVDSYECGKIYGSELSLVGFLRQDL